MCTVTYIPINKNDFILTSSRDVPFTREKALRPKKYLEDTIEITYPKDGRASGTWIGHSSKNRLICLLNGGFENHISEKTYRKSRGLIVKDLLKENEIFSALNKIDLDNIEPFTLVIVDWNALTGSATVSTLRQSPVLNESTKVFTDSETSDLQLIEFVWDGKTKHIKVLDQEKHIWSSSTLYDKKMKQLRKNWFSKWSLKNKKKDILNFHYKAGIGDANIDVIMKREKVGTVSITQISKINKKINMNYKEIT